MMAQVLRLPVGLTIWRPGSLGSGANSEAATFWSLFRQLSKDRSWSCSQNGSPEVRHARRRFSEFADLELSLLYLLCQFDAADNHCRSLEALQTQHRSQSLFDSPVVLFNPVI